MGDHLRRQPRPEDGALTFWVITERPLDFPNGYVVRRRCVVDGGVWIDPIGIGCDTLDAARAQLPPGLINIGRQPGDERQIKEVWV